MLSHNDLLLLRSAFLASDRARSAWRSWTAQVDIEDHHHADVYRLLPQVCGTLETADPDYPYLDLLRSVRRKAWYQTRLEIREGLHAQQSLEKRGLASIVIGAAGIAAAGRIEGLEVPVDQYDLLVDHHQAEDARRILESSGWTLVAGPSPGDVESRIRRVLRGPTGRHVAIHRYLVPSGDEPVDGPSVEAQARVVDLDGTAVRVPGAPHQLLGA
ncbi:MAG: hypothetical protein R3178_02810, partial [Rhodothermales bacterium]|nr:hypothetical protein [Rhodothermales bacterium]